MKIRQSHIGALAKHIFKRLQSKNLATFSKTEEEIVLKFEETFRQNFEEEEKINTMARKLLDQNKAKLGLTIDEEKAFNMIKKQLAKEKNFVL